MMLKPPQIALGRAVLAIGDGRRSSAPYGRAASAASRVLSVRYRILPGSGKRAAMA